MYVKVFFIGDYRVRWVSFRRGDPQAGRIVFRWYTRRVWHSPVESERDEHTIRIGVVWIDIHASPQIVSLGQASPAQLHKFFVMTETSQ